VLRGALQYSRYCVNALTDPAHHLQGTDRMSPYWWERVKWPYQFEALDGIADKVLAYRPPARTKKAKKRQRKRRKASSG
jgi:hypothetical protein